MNLPTKAELDNAWPFTAGAIDSTKLGPLVLDGERETTTPAPIRLPAFDVGQRVIVKPTPGSPDPTIRKGGLGTVCHTKDVTLPGRPRTETMVYVLVDGAKEVKPEPYHVCEVRPEPTI